MSRVIASQNQKNLNRSMERTNYNVRARSKYSQGAEDNAYAEKVHISPRKMENILILRSPEMKKTQGTLDSLNKNGRHNIETIIAGPEDAECICQICTCGKHYCPSRKVKYRYPKNMKTSYNQSFYEKPSIGNKQFDYDKNKPKFFIVHDIDKNSTYLHDYPKHKVKPKIIRPVLPSQAELGMPLETTYGNNFPNWNYLDKDTSERKPYGYKPIEFRGDSHYRERFKPPIVDPVNKVVMSNEKNPLDSDFNKETTYRTEFINFNKDKPKRVQMIEQFTPIKSFPGQFDTTVRREFKDKTKKQCPVLKYEGVSDILAKSSLYLNPDRNMSFY